MIEIANKYFVAWNAHNTKKLCLLFAHDIHLKDWEINEYGIENVLLANQKIFTNVPEIKAEIIELGVGSNKVIAQIKIHLNEDEMIDVVDVLEIKNNLIQSIQAYKC